MGKWQKFAPIACMVWIKDNMDNGNKDNDLLKTQLSQDRFSKDARQNTQQVF